MNYAAWRWRPKEFRRIVWPQCEKYQRFEGTNFRRCVVATTITKNPQTRKVVGKDGGETGELPFEVVQEDRETLSELMSQAQAAYESYLQAQRGEIV
jgi:hypothetical protein